MLAYIRTDVHWSEHVQEFREVMTSVAPAKRGSASELRSRLDRELQHSILQAILDASPDGILVVDGAGIIISHNRRFLEIWDLPSRHLSGTHPGSAVGARDDPILAQVLDRLVDRDAFLARVQALYADPRQDDYCEIELKDGRTLERHSTGLFGQRDQYLGRVWFFRDVTTRKQTESALKELSRTDPLTGIMNRRYFAERAAQEFARSRRSQSPFAVVEFDIDHFKLINDEHGHSAGDALLVAVCNQSRVSIREANLFARIGGEEFVVLLPETDLEGGIAFAERIRATIAGLKLPLADDVVSCTISLGVAAMRGGDSSVEDSLLRADQAMYRAKQRGRNRVEGDPPSA